MAISDVFLMMTIILLYYVSIMRNKEKLDIQSCIVDCYMDNMYLDNTSITMCKLRCYTTISGT
jgi:hypothetical protein